MNITNAKSKIMFICQVKSFKTMINKTKLAAAAVIAFLSIQNFSCTKSVVVKEPCFEEDVLPIFVSKCSMEGCHGAGGGSGRKGGNHGYNLTTYDGIMKGVKANHPLQSSLFKSCNGLNPAMPPTKSERLTREQLSTIRYWINMGAPNTTNCSGGNCDTTANTFASTIEPILKTNCVGCHNASTMQGNIDLSSYTAVYENAINSKLVGSIKQVDAKYKAMPPNTKLSTCNIAKIESWVNAGSKNN